MKMLLLWSLACIGRGLEVGLIGNCGEQPCVAALVSSTIHLDIKGATATAKLQQVFRGSQMTNGESRRESKMKDTYFLFPIHAGMVVTGLTAEIDGRFLEAKVMERREAQKSYEKAKETRCPAALAHHGPSEDDTGDLYRISLGNIPTQKLTMVNFSFVQELDLQDSDMKNQGFLRLLLPALVGAPSRYSSDLEGVAKEKLLQAATHQAPSIQLHIAIEPPAIVASPSHSLLSTQELSHANQTLKFVDMRLWEDISKDFVLHIHFSHQDTNLFQPRAVLEKHPKLKTWVAVAELVPRFSWDLLTNVEISILVDRSGSMQGKMHFARQALEHFIRSCPYQAFVNVLGFGSNFQKLFNSPVQLKEKSFQIALEHAKTLEANLGGTELGTPLEHILKHELKEGVYRRVLVLTDGEVWDTHRIISIAKHCEENCEIHTLGLGSGVSTALLQRLATNGHGTAHFLADGEEEALQETVVHMLSAALQSPVTDLQVHWPSSPRLLSHRAIKEVDDAIVHQEAEGLFQSGNIRRPSEILEENSAEDQERRTEKLRAENVQQFSAQGGFLRPVQVGTSLQKPRSGKRWSAYAFLGFMNDSQLPDEISMTGKMNGHDFDLKLPVIRSNGSTLHALAAWHLSEILSTKGPWPELEDAHGFSWEDAHWQIVALGVTYGIATSKTSWLALAPEKHQAERKSDQPAQAIDLQSVGSSISLRSFSRLGASISVLDFVHLGSSLSVRSFCRLGSSISVYGCARLGSTFSVLDFGDMSSGLSLRSFSQLAAEQTTTLYSSTISSVSLQPFMKRGAQVSLPSFSQLGSTPFPDDIHQIASSLSMPSNELIFLSTKVSEHIDVPIALLKMERRSFDQPYSCSNVALGMNVTPIDHVLKTTRGLGYSFPEHFGFLDLSNATDLNPLDIRISQNCTLQSTQLRMRLNVSKLRNRLNTWEDDLEMIKELNPENIEMDVKKWGCPPLSRQVEMALLDSQRADGAFHWPKKFFQHLHSPIGQDMDSVQSEFLSTALAIAALRRCFGPTSALVERKAIAWLGRSLELPEIELWISFANAVVLQRFMYTEA